MTDGYKSIAIKDELHQKLVKKQMELTLKRQKTVFLTETIEAIIEKGFDLVNE